MSKYKVGDRVKIKSLDWYNKNKDNCGCVYAGNGFGFWKDMTKHCGKIMKIASVKIDPEDSNKGYYFMENNKDKWTDEMIEGLVEDESKFGTASNPIEIKLNINCFTQDRVGELATKIDKELPSGNQNVWELPNGYIFKDENDNIINATRIILEKKKKEYPKTYEECCKVMGVNHTNDLDICEHCDYKTEITYYEDNLLEKIEVLYRLIICRDAYRKIAGEEMGLGKPWEPDFTNDDEERYGIYTAANKVVKDFCGVGDVNMIFTFPTETMRDTFYENFKELIDECKELL